MRAAYRRIDPGLIDQLASEPQRFEFFQAVRLLDRALRQEGVGRHADPVSERIRFTNSLSLAFAPSQIEALAVQHAANSAGTQAGVPDAVDITPGFMGLLGIHGASPVHYTERVATHERVTRDRAARAFFDLFSNRSVGHFYRAWRKYRLPLQYELDRRNQFLPYLLSLCGLGFDALRDRFKAAPGVLDDESIAYFAGLLRQRPVSAATLETVLRSYLGVPVRVEPFVGKWYVVPAEARTCLGGANACLGHAALLGARAWQRNLRVRIHIGPLDRARYHALLPGGEHAAALGKLLAFATGAQFEYELRPILRAADVSPAQLDGAAGVRLGFDTFLATRPESSDRCDLAYEHRPIH